jgi:hypothetical protein
VPALLTLYSLVVLALPNAGGAGRRLLSTVAIAAAAPAAWVAVGVCVRAFLNRHNGKRLRWNHHGLVDAVGYSASDITAIARALTQDKPPAGDRYVRSRGRGRTGVPDLAGSRRGPIAANAPESGSSATAAPAPHSPIG